MPAAADSDRSLISAIHQVVFENTVSRRAIKAGFDEARAILEGPNYSLPYSTCSISISLIHEELSPEFRGSIGLCRVFILRAGQKMSPPEIHRNSIQRLVSFKGQGVIHSASLGDENLNFIPYPLRSPDLDPSAEVTEYWDVVAENVWHYPEAAAESDWYTVAFHSAAEDAIIDERWEEAS